MTDTSHDALSPLDGLDIASAVRVVADRLTKAGKPDARAEAREIVRRALNIDAAQMMARGAAGVAAEELGEINAVLARRLAGEPLDNIIGEREFFGRAYRVTPDVLSPRDDTEVLVRRALEVLGGIASPRVLDLGTGSGAIAISLLAERPDMSAVGVDLSPRALLVAEGNAARHGVADRFDLVEGSWFDHVEGRFDAVLSNPPYITDAAMRDLEREVADYDPDLALRGGADGLDAYRVLIAEARDHTLSGAPILLEIGHDLGPPVCLMLEAAGFERVRVLPDLAGHDRVVEGFAPPHAG